MRLIIDIIIIIVATVLVSIGILLYRGNDIGDIRRNAENIIKGPCAKPLAYSIGSIDPRFELSQEDLLSGLAKAESIWEEPLGKDLFAYSPEGEIKVNLIYDARQQATDDLRKLGIVVDNNRDSYDELKRKYESLIAEYKSEKIQLESSDAAFDRDKDAYEKDVAALNARGGGTKEEVQKYDRIRENLNKRVNETNKQKESFNKLVETIRSAELVLNDMIRNLNLQIGKYNEIGSSSGEEYNQGIYVRDDDGTRIDIFQFSDNLQLVRVLAHEFGHALDIEHIDNPEAIMYYLNEGINDTLTDDDLAAVKKACKMENP